MRGAEARRRTVEQPQDVQRIARGIRTLAAKAALTVVHGGGKEIDAALALAGIPKRQVDGLRVTDAPTLDAVVAVLAGSINTRLVAAVRQAGGAPVGLTGADAGVAVVKRAAPIVSTAGETVDLGLVGTPAPGGDPALLVGSDGQGVRAGGGLRRRHEAGAVAQRERRHAGLAPGGARSRRSGW